MSENSDLTRQIAETAAGPKSYENDGEKISSHPLPDLIAADRHLSRKKVARNPFGALKIAQISTQGPEK